MKRREYSTRQRSTILELLEENSDGYLTAGEIIAHLHARGEKVGATTVYRSLKRMAEAGQVRRYKGTGEGSCYQLTRDGCEDHLHLRCSGCGAIIHLDCTYMEKMNAHLLKHHGFQVDEGKTVLYGVCEKCRAPKSEMM